MTMSLTFPPGGGESWSQEKCLDRTLRQTPVRKCLAPRNGPDGCCLLSWHSGAEKGRHRATVALPRLAAVPTREDRVGAP